MMKWLFLVLPVIKESLKQDLESKNRSPLNLVIVVQLLMFTLQLVLQVSIRD